MRDMKILFDAVRRIKGAALTQADVDAINAALGPQAPSPGERTIGKAGLDLIKASEGLELRSYRDAVGVWTVGYGHTGADVYAGQVITEAQADELLAKDVARFEAAVRKLCPVTTQGQFDGLVSFAYNLGENALKESTLRRRHNEGDHAGAAAEFQKWNKARVNGVLKELAGLTKRRAAEKRLYLS